MEFVGEAGDGAYHSIQDSYENYVKFCDPNFDYGIALAQTTGHILLRVANSDVIPLEFNQFANAIERYSADVEKLFNDMREGTKLTNEWIANKTFYLVSNPQEPVMPKTNASVPSLDWKPLHNAVETLKASAQKFESTRTRIEAARHCLPPATQLALDAIFQRIEQTLIYPEGLPHHPWYRNLADAPGLYTGYAAKTLPGVREAIEQRDWTVAEKQIEILASALRHYANEIDRASDLLSARRQ